MSDPHDTTPPFNGAEDTGTADFELTVELDLPRTLELIEEGIERSWHLGMQVSVWWDRTREAHVAVGENTHGVPLRPDTLMLWLSSGKPVTAVALLRLVEQDRLQLDDPVARYVPEFAGGGKRDVTVFQLLTHTAGLRPVPSGWPNLEWDEIIKKACKGRLRKDWVPGQQAAYDPSQSWFILGEILRRVDGRPIDRIVREDIFEPLEMWDCWMSLAPRFHVAYGERVGVMHNLRDGWLQPTNAHEAEVCESPSPGSSCRGPMSQLARFYRMLLAGGSLDGQQILSADTVRLMTRRHREGLHDVTFNHIIDMGLGVIIDSNRYGPETVPYGFGRHASEETFGHGGAKSSMGMADPRHNLVICAAANGSAGEADHQRRFRDLLSAVYEDLSLV